jgi:hypothetical protein
MTGTLPPLLHRGLATDVAAAARLARAKGLELAFDEDLAYARFCAERLERRQDPVALARTMTFVANLHQRIQEASPRRAA